MRTTGTPLRNWTLLLLLCSVSASALAEAANEAANGESSATAHEGATPQHTSTPASSSTYSPSPSSVRRYASSGSTCPYRTINYITHTLPQQCAKTSWSAPGEAVATAGPGAEEGAIAGLQTPTPAAGNGSEGDTGVDNGATSVVVSEAGSTAATTNTASTAEPELDLEADSPFDNANFLSFEEWKKRNLAAVGQSPENVGQGRAAGTNQPARRRPVNVNVLDSLGDEGEISIDFSGFGSPEDENVANSIQHGKQSAGASKAADGEGKVAPSSWALSKDAGKTCKERFNFASFDCAATVLKTNKQAKSSSSILVENKDSYMLNICSADNKFLIVELCDDILVDTIVLANYEFFSSMFRHFRVSVSDRYPVKLEKWRTLGTFEARNSRDIQPFLITEPQIWARYLRVEFLTQFGNEYYCPLSVLRVHGTTMMEQFRQEEEEARGIDDDDDLEADGVEVKKPAADSGPLSPEEIPIEAAKDPGIDDTNEDVSSEAHAGPSSEALLRRRSQQSRRTNHLRISPAYGAGSENITAYGEPKSSDTPPPKPTDGTLQAESSSSDASTNNSSDSVSRVDTATAPTDNATASSSGSPAAKASSNSTVASPPAQGRGSSTQPNAPAPSTQESFFKSIHKRLQYLEANSTLSLQYIEEQSRALRDAFVKVEKRQLAKTEKFLDHLNSTVMLELKSFRNMYDQLWQSTVIELESMKERQQSEMGEIGTRLTLLADELVWQKRMAVVQSTLLLLCLGLVLFVRSGTLGGGGGGNDMPIVQQLGSKYSSFFESSPPRRMSEAEGMSRQRRTFRNMWRSGEASGHLSDHHDHRRDSDGGVRRGGNGSDTETEGLRSPSPPVRSIRTNGIHADSAGDNDDDDYQNEPETPITTTTTAEDQATRIQVLETQSGPATPNGTRDSRPSWEEVERAVDLLKAEEEEQQQQQNQQQQQQLQHQEYQQQQRQGQKNNVFASSPPNSPGGSPGRKRRRKREKGGGKAVGVAAAAEMRSPLRRSYSSFDGGGGE
ncbi:unnamed protein product [Alternaria alternata]